MTTTQIIGLVLSVAAVCAGITAMLLPRFQLYVHVHTRSRKVDRNRLQYLVDCFNEAYQKAFETSEDEDWLNAALLGRQVVKVLGQSGLVRDDRIHVGCLDSDIGTQERNSNDKCY